MDDFRLLIHHHAVVYQNASNELFIPSFIGRWVNALSEHVGHIGLLFYQSDVHRPEQDEIITASNVTLWSLGAPGKTWDRISRIKRLRKVCTQATQFADGLLIRGVTPRQLDVWNSVSVQHKAFLLVGSLLESRSVFRPTFWGIYESLMPYWRKHEVMRIARQGILMANSPLIVSEIAQLKRSATFVPTNSIRRDEFAPLHIRDLSNHPKILFCGRVVAEKGIWELFHAIAEICSSNPVELNIVGPVDASYRHELDALAIRLGVFENIKWHGRVPYGDALFSFYREADVFVLPTYYEGFPHVLWEAAANCCPIVTTSVGGIPAFLENEKHCLLVKPKNSFLLATALKRLFSDISLRSLIIKHAYQLATNYTVDACAKILVDVLSAKWKNNQNS